MGLLGCPSSFQRLVELQWEDNLLLHSKSHVEHQEQLEKLFGRLRTAGLKVNLANFEFRSTNVSYLSYRLTTLGILPWQDKLKAVWNNEPPKNVLEVRQCVQLLQTTC
jgi:hypothetical protein